MGPFDPEKWPRFVRFPSFTRDWERLGLDDADLQSLEHEILINPTRSPVIQGTRGLRKIRFSGLRAARCKSGSYRVCYVYLPEFGTVAIVVIFGKSEKDNLNHAVMRFQQLSRHTEQNSNENLVEGNPPMTMKSRKKATGKPIDMKIKESGNGPRKVSAQEHLSRVEKLSPAGSKIVSAFH